MQIVALCNREDDTSRAMEGRRGGGGERVAAVAKELSSG